MDVANIISAHFDCWGLNLIALSSCRGIGKCHILSPCWRGGRMPFCSILSISSVLKCSWEEFIFSYRMWRWVTFSQLQLSCFGRNSGFWWIVSSLLRSCNAADFYRNVRAARCWRLQSMLAHIQLLLLGPALWGK